MFDQFGNKLDTTDADKSVKEAKKELKGLEKQLKDNKKKKVLAQDEAPPRPSHPVAPGGPDSSKASGLRSPPLAPVVLLAHRLALTPRGRGAPSAFSVRPG